jgi:WD40 repeat protein
MASGQSYFLSSADDGRLVKWNISSGAVISTTAAMTSNYESMGLAFGGGGQYVLASVRLNISGTLTGYVRVYTASTMAFVRQLTANRIHKFHNIISYGDFVFAPEYTTDGLIHQWRISDGVLVQSFNKTGSSVFMGVFVSGDLLVSGAHNGLVHLFNTTTGLWMAQLAGHASTNIPAITIYGDYIFSGSGVRCFDCKFLS